MKAVKLSVNAPLTDSRLLKAAGFHYIEPSNTDIMKLSSAEFSAAVDELTENQMKCRVIDNPIPCSVSFSDADWDIEQWKTYLTESASRGKQLGAKYWCIGNGLSRMIYGDKERVSSNFRKVIEKCLEIGEEQGIAVIVEPLGPSVTNYLNSVEAVTDFIESMGRKNVYTMVDYRWEYEQDRPIQDLYDCAEKIVHAHIDNPNTDYAGQKIRRIQTLRDGVDYGPFLEFIRSRNFRGILSIEANTFSNYEQELRQVMEFYRQYDIVSAE